MTVRYAESDFLSMGDDRCPNVYVHEYGQMGRIPNVCDVFGLRWGRRFLSNLIFGCSVVTEQFSNLRPYFQQYF